MAEGRKTIAPPARFSTKRKSLLDDTIERELRCAGDRGSVAVGSATDKKNYAEEHCRAPCRKQLADALRETFEGILPDARGIGQDSRARTGKGLKKLDVNYSTVELEHWARCLHQDHQFSRCENEKIHKELYSRRQRVEGGSRGLS